MDNYEKKLIQYEAKLNEITEKNHMFEEEITHYEKSIDKYERKLKKLYRSTKDDLKQEQSIRQEIEIENQHLLHQIEELQNSLDQNSELSWSTSTDPDLDPTSP